MARILVVDDNPLNRELLCDYLAPGNHTVIEADSGEAALSLAATERPDLVLLDVMMPGLNGFETTKRLKQLASDEFLPIILITALSDHTSRVLGLQSGADDFLTKPLDRLELGVRMTNLLALRTKELALLRANTAHAELHRFKDELSAMLVHDLKNPMAAVLCNLDYVLEEPGKLEESQVEALRDARSASQRAVRLTNNLLDVARMEASRFAIKCLPTSIAGLMAPIISQRSVIARNREVTILGAIDPELTAEVDSDLLIRVFENLFDNAARFTPKGGRIEVSGQAVGSAAQIRIGNTGPGIPVGAHKLIFEKFGQASPNIGRANLGLGLYFCRLAAEAHGGRIWVEETPALPTVFILELPLVSTARPPA